VCSSKVKYEGSKAYCLVKCHHTADGVWKSYSNLSGKRTEGCEKCRLEKVTKYKPDEIKHVSRWKNMRRRCDYPKSTGYHRYGGRGISYHEDFKDFHTWLEYTTSLENAFQDGYTIDRIDNDGDYTYDNIKWSTQEEQNNNKNIKKITYKEEEYPLKTFAEKYSAYCVQTTYNHFNEGATAQQLIERSFKKSVRSTERREKE
jgi:hypothetical protein